MGRFFRRFFCFAFHAAASFSALALVACVILWPLSHRYGMHLGYATSGGSYCMLGAGGGRLWVQYDLRPWLPPGFACEFAPIDLFANAWSYTDWQHVALPELRGTSDRALGGEWFRSDDGGFLGIPLLHLTLLSAILPAFWLRGFVRRRRQARGRGFPIEAVV